jgi:alanine racemase
VAAAGLLPLVDAEVRAAGGAVTTAPEAEVADPRTLWGLPGGDGRPVLSLVGRLLSTKTLRAGEGVSYGYTFRAARDTVVGLVAGGYAQGVVREVGNRAHVRVGEHSLPIVGRVAMDACVIEVGGADAAAGADVVFFGDPDRCEPSLADWEAVTRMRAAEIVSLAGARASREDVR